MTQELQITARMTRRCEVGVANEVRKEVDELLERLTTDEMEDLLEQLRRRFKQDNDELRNIYQQET